MSNNWSKVLIPMVRKMMPGIIAQEIVGVQPMSGVDQEPVRPKFRRVDQVPDGLPPPPDGYITVDVGYEVARWLNDQPIHMWKFCDVPAYSMSMERYTVSEQLYTMMALKWS